MMENSLSHKSGASKTLYNVAIKVSLLLSNICMRTDPFCFAVTWCPSATSMNLYASMARMSNDDVSKNKDYGDSSQLTNWILDSGAT